MARAGAIVKNQADGSGVGDVRYSMLTEAEFQTQNGTSWVLMDGRNVAGSRYAILKSVTNIPDHRGVTPRVKNNGRSDGNQDPAGERALGSFQDDAMQQITGFVRWRDSAGALSNWEGASGSFTGSNEGFGSPARGGLGGNIGNTNLQLNSALQTKTATDTRTRNLALNAFIKIN